MIRSWAAARHLQPATTGTVASTLVGALVAPPTIDVGLENPVVAAWFVLLALVVSASLPLTPVYGLLEETFVRAPIDRLYRTACVSALLLLGTATMQVLDVATLPIVLWAVLLMTTAMVVATMRGELVWSVLLALGGASTVWEHTDLSRPVTNALAHVPVWLVASSYAGGAILYVARGR